MSNLGDSYTSPVRSQDRDVILSSASVAIGAVGAATVTGSPGINVVRTGAGTYDLSYKASPAGRFFVFIAQSATVFSVKGTAFVPTDDTAGATFVTANAAGAATDPADGDILHILHVGLPSVAT